MEENVGTLDHYVKKALDFFEEKGDYKLELPDSFHTLVIGSQSGLLAGRITYRFSGRAFSHAQEVLARHEINTKSKILGDVTIFSATGSRNVVPIAQYALDKGLRVNAVVCGTESQLNEQFKNHENYNEILVEIPEEREEPPTINTATYGRMIQGATGENISTIRQVVGSLKEPDGGYGRFKSFTVIFPDSMPEVAEMVDWKLRGEKIGRCVGTTSVYLTNFMHGAGVTDADSEVYIAAGLSARETEIFKQVFELVPAERKHHIDVLEGFGPLGYMMLGYSVVGQIQKSYPAFQERIWGYGKRTKKWEWLSPVCSAKK